MLSWTLAANMLFSDPPRVNSLLHLLSNILYSDTPRVTSLLDLLKHINLVQTELDDAERVVSNKRFDCTSRSFSLFSFD